MLSFPVQIRIIEIGKLSKECDIVTKVCIQKLETAYGWSYDGCKCDTKPHCEDDKLVCKKCSTGVLSTEPKFKLHYKVYDATGKCSVLFFNRLAEELLGTKAAILKEKETLEDDISHFPSRLSDCVGKEYVMRLKLNEYNLKYPNSSIAVVQFSSECHILDEFKYSTRDEEAVQEKE